MKKLVILMFVAMWCGTANISAVLGDDGFQSIFDGKTLANWEEIRSSGL